MQRKDLSTDELHHQVMADQQQRGPVCPAQQHNATARRCSGGRQSLQLVNALRAGGRRAWDEEAGGW